MTTRLQALRKLTVERCNVQELAGLLRHANAHPGIVADWLTEHSMGRSPVQERDVCLLFARDRLACRGTDWPVLLPAVFRPETFCEWAGRIGRPLAPATPVGPVAGSQPRLADACRMEKCLLLARFDHLVYAKNERPCPACRGGKRTKRPRPDDARLVAGICGICWGSGVVGYTLTARDLVPPDPRAAVRAAPDAYRQAARSGDE